MKRFYRAVTVAPVEGGWGIQLDGKALRTPAKRPLILPNEALAAAIAGEWDAQTEAIRPGTMPLMKLASTAIDLVGIKAVDVAEEVARYAETDLLCYRATEPEALVERERAVWQPLLDWASLRFDSPLNVASGIVAVTQPDSSLRALRAVVAGFDAMTLTAVADLTASFGSLILALAVWDGRLGAAQAFEAAILDERFQAERWGEDEEAAERRAAVAREVEAAGRFLGLVSYSNRASVVSVAEYRLPTRSPRDRVEL
jgi:chaperone required for assembly of F1-ATPase